MGPIILLVVLGTIIVLSYLYFYCMRPLPVKDHSLDFLLYTPIAHRGLHGQEKNAPENSLRAFSLAIEKGYPIEIDVWLSKDGEVMVFHDGLLERLTGEQGHIREMTLQQIKQLRLLGTEQTIPTLRETLELVDGRVPLLIEIKEYMDGQVPQKTWELLRPYRGKYAVQSFDFRNVRWFKKNAGQVPRGQLAMRLGKGKGVSFVVRWAGRNLLTNFLTRPQFVAYHYPGLGSYAVRAVRRLKGKVLCWTVTSQDIADQVKKDTDNIIFEGFIPKG